MLQHGRGGAICTLADLICASHPAEDHCRLPECCLPRPAWAVSCLSKVGAPRSGRLHLGTMALLLAHFLPITITVSIVNVCSVGQFFLLNRRNTSNRMLWLSCDRSSRRVKTSRWHSSNL